MDENLRYQLKFLDYAPILHISAATGERTPKLLEMVDKVAAAATTRVPTGELNRFIEKLTTASPPVTSGKRNVRVMYASQTSKAPPTFVLFTNSRGQAAFFVRALPREPAARGLRFFRQPDPHPGARPAGHAQEPAGSQDRGRARARPAQAGEEGAGLETDQCRPRAEAESRPAAKAKRGVKPGTKAASAKGLALGKLADATSRRVYTWPEWPQPKRELFKAAEVCEVVQLQPYVLRSWEAEFPQIGQAPAGGGPRVYRRADIELVLRIKQLILDEGLTLSGARRRLEEDGDKSNGATRR